MLGAIARVRVPLFVAILATSAAATDAQGAMSYRYTFQFDAINFQGVVLDAATFSFEVPGILNQETSQTAQQIGTLNGYVTPSFRYSYTDYDLFLGTPQFNQPVGAVADFAFIPQGPVLAVGTYESRPDEAGPNGAYGAGRGIKQADGSIRYYYTSGRLIVSATGAVPEPASVTLCGIALGLGVVVPAARRLRGRSKSAA